MPKCTPVLIFFKVNLDKTTKMRNCGCAKDGTSAVCMLCQGEEKVEMLTALDGGGDACRYIGLSILALRCSL